MITLDTIKWTNTKFIKARDISKLLRGAVTKLRNTDSTYILHTIKSIHFNPLTKKSPSLETVLLAAIILKN